MLKQFLKVLLLLVCAVYPYSLHAKMLTIEEAAEAAANFFNAGNISRLSNPDAFELAYTSQKVTGHLLIMCLMPRMVVDLSSYQPMTRQSRLWDTLMSLYIYRMKYLMSLR